MNRLIARYSAIFMVGLLSLGVACGGRSSETGTAAESSGPIGASVAKTGVEVGNQIPGFRMRLSDGSTLTSADLLSEGRPVFFYFFATW